MEPLLAPARPGPAARIGPAVPDGHGSGPEPPISIGLCAAWSRHAAELAVPIGTALQHWEETPPTRVLVAEGYLTRLLPGRYVPPDVLRSAVRRALALGCALGARLQSHYVIAGPSAAWVLLGGEPPAPAELLSPAHRGEVAGVVLRTARLRPDEVETIGGTPITIPVRTAMDLLRFTPAAVATPLLRGLVDSGHVEVDEVRRRLHRMHRHPGVQSARERWEAVLGGQRDVSGAAAPTGLPSAVTRYTS
ncbi:hypothetical protein [Brachybacterium vulturis]|uniref:hypothetical protein n=1 Tax=Brachybacterium vulturis TaxID=2017484 RepID=UPI001FE3D722|nr:hypothetical protein [Brachybacterium vulturis]